MTQENGGSCRLNLEQAWRLNVEQTREPSFMVKAVAIGGRTPESRLFQSDTAGPLWNDPALGGQPERAAKARGALPVVSCVNNIHTYKQYIVKIIGVSQIEFQELARLLRWQDQCVAAHDTTSNSSEKETL
jgi:hypothetical protein